MKRIIGAALALALLLGFTAWTPGASAEGLGAAGSAEALHALGFMDGVGTNADGSVDYALGGTANRQTATTMLVRVLGGESAAQSGSWSPPFSDFDDWARPYVGYAHANGLVNGVSDASFGGLGTVTAQMYVTMMLRALGYNDDAAKGATDFTYDTACDYAKTIGLTDGSYTNATSTFTRGDIAVISFSALGLQKKGAGKTLFSATTGRADSELESARATGLAAAGGATPGSSGATPTPKPTTSPTPAPTPTASTTSPAVVLYNTAPGKSVSMNAAKTVTIDYSNAGSGYVMLKVKLPSTPKLAVIVTAPSGTEYKYFSTDTAGNYQAFPLTEGSGSYKLGVYKNTTGNSYAVLHSTTFRVNMTDSNAPFLRPNIYVDYGAGTKAVTAAETLCAGCATELDKVGAVYYYIIDSFTYDYAKATTVESGYRPVLDTVWEAKKGICFDYASVMAAMLRSQGVYTRLNVGYAGSTYHAWVSVYTSDAGWIEAVIYFDGTNWKLMDPTFASTGRDSVLIRDYINNPDNYKTKYTY